MAQEFDEELVNNHQQRLPCVLILDTSFSMRGKPIDEMEEGIKLFEKDIKSDDDAKEKVDIMIKSYERASKSDKIIQSKLFDLRLELLNLNQEINGSESRSKIGEPNEYPTIWSYIWAARSSLSNTYGPTKTQINSINIATNMYDKFIVSYNEIQQDIIPILSDLEKINAPKINTY